MMFFTPGRTIGLLVLLAVMGVVIYLIKRLEAGAGSRREGTDVIGSASPESDSPTTEPQPTATPHAAPSASTRRKRRRHGR